MRKEVTCRRCGEITGEDPLVRWCITCAQNNNCRNCEGVGAVWAKNGNASTCSRCKGTRQDPDPKTPKRKTWGSRSLLTFVVEKPKFPPPIQRVKATPQGIHPPHKEGFVRLPPPVKDPFVRLPPPSRQPLQPSKTRLPSKAPLPRKSRPKKPKTLKQQILDFYKGHVKGFPVPNTAVYKRFPAHKETSLRGVISNLVREGKVERVKPGLVCWV
jgi:hypothetical protein